MKDKVKKILENKSKTVPILSFPSAQLMGITVKELISSSHMQKEGMKKIAERCNVGASLNMMDLSVEAEAFGAEIVFKDDEIPTVAGGVIADISDAESIKVPSVNDKRCRIYIDGVKHAKEEIKHIPVFCGVIGPYSLAGRLFDMTELMMECYDSPDEVKILLEKATCFIIKYIKAFKAAGADGVIMAEPAAGLLSPALNDEFSLPYVKRIMDEVNSEDFVFCYHNCGDNVVHMADSLASLNCDIYHFGNAVKLSQLIPAMPKDSIVMGNVDPVLFKMGDVASIKECVQRIYDECKGFDNFMLSSGCDIPSQAKWENIDAYFEKVNEIYV
ncbi:MAG: uroporphyrinogen decarboxylase family protein [Clostridia bacterium]|nr:uroporphyrinogen decarboxylase family protein [Clostridia bacterium]